MKNYYRIMLGAKSMYADKCYTDTFIGADFDIDWDLSNALAGPQPKGKILKGLCC